MKHIEQQIWRPKKNTKYDGGNSEKKRIGIIILLPYNYNYKYNNYN